MKPLAKKHSRSCRTQSHGRSGARVDADGQCAGCTRNDYKSLMIYPRILMTRILMTLVLLLACGLLSVTAQGQQTAADASAEQAIQQFLDEAGDWGFCAAVWADGKVAWSRQWGDRDKENSLPVTPDTMFRIGSVSKLITATTLMSMAEQDQISLDKTIDNYLSDLSESYANINSRMLAGHLSGIRHYSPQRMRQEYMSRTAYDSQRAAMKVFASDPLLHQPGEAYFYSTYGYTVLGAVMEQVGQKPLSELFRQQVYEPAGMSNTYGEHNETVSGEIAVPYAVYGGREMIMPPVNNSGKLGGGGVVSTAIDLARFLGAVAENRLVSKETFAEMLVTQKTASGEDTGVGIGWRIAEDSSGRSYIHHGGSAAGGRAFVLLYPEQNVGVALIMNVSGNKKSFAEELAMQVAGPFLTESMPSSKSAGSSR